MDKPKIDNEIRLNPDLVPKYVWESLAASTLELVRSIKKTPEGRKALEEEKAKLRAEMAEKAKRGTSK